MAAAPMAAADVSEETVEAMAAYYGLKLPEEKYLLWIARQACVEPLPDGYQEFQDDDGNTFYFNSQTQQSTFDNPLDETFKFLINKERQKYKESIKAAAEAIGSDSGGDAPAAAFTRPRRGRGGRGRSAGRTGSTPAPTPTPVPAAELASIPANDTAATPPVDPANSATREMAEYLGINPHTEPHLMWIAAAALQDQILPPEWREYTDDHGNRYYHNTITDLTTYDHPLDEKHKKTIERERAAASTPAQMSSADAATARAAEATAERARVQVEQAAAAADKKAQEELAEAVAAAEQKAREEAAAAAALAEQKVRKEAAAAEAAARKKAQEEEYVVAKAAEEARKKAEAEAAAKEAEKAREKAEAEAAAKEAEEARQKAEAEAAAKEAEEARQKAEAEAAAKEAEEARQKAEAEAAAAAANREAEQAATEEQRVARAAAEKAAAEEKMRADAKAATAAPAPTPAPAAGAAAVASEARESVAPKEGTPKHGRRRGVATVANNSQETSTLANSGRMSFAPLAGTPPKLATSTMPLHQPEPEPYLQATPDRQPEPRLKPEPETERESTASEPLWLSQRDIVTDVSPLATAAAKWLSADAPAKGGDGDLVPNDLAAARLAELAAKREHEAAQPTGTARAEAKPVGAYVAEANAGFDTNTFSASEIKGLNAPDKQAVVVAEQVQAAAQATVLEDRIARDELLGDTRDNHIANDELPVIKHDGNGEVVALHPESGNPSANSNSSTVSSVQSTDGSFSVMDKPKSPSDGDNIGSVAVSSTVEQVHAASRLNPGNVAVEENSGLRLEAVPSSAEVSSQPHNFSESMNEIEQPTDMSHRNNHSLEASRMSSSSTGNAATTDPTGSGHLAAPHVIPTVNRFAESNVAPAAPDSRSTVPLATDTVWLQRMFERNEQERQHQESIIEAQKQQLERMERLLHDRSRLYPGEMAPIHSQEVRAQAWTPWRPEAIGPRNSRATLPAEQECSISGSVAPSVMISQPQRTEAWPSVSPPKLAPTPGRDRNFVATFVSAVSSLRQIVEQSATGTGECASIVTTICEAVSPVTSLLRTHIANVCDDTEIRHVQDALAQFESTEPQVILRASLTICSVLGRIVQQRKQAPKRPSLPEEPGLHTSAGTQSANAASNAAESMKEMLREELQKKEIERLRLENEQLRQAKLNATNSFADPTVSDLASSLKLLLGRLGASDAATAPAPAPAPASTFTSTPPADNDANAEAASQSSPPEHKLKELYLKLKADSDSDVQAVRACLKHAFWAVGDGKGRLELACFHEFIEEMCGTLDFECGEETSAEIFRHVCGSCNKSDGICADDFLEAMQGAVSESDRGSSTEEASHSEIEEPATVGALKDTSVRDTEYDGDVTQGQTSQTSEGSSSDCGASATSSNESSALSFTSVPRSHASNRPNLSSAPEASGVESSLDHEAHYGEAGLVEASTTIRTASAPENGWRIPTSLKLANPTPKHNVAPRDSDDTRQYTAEAEQALSSAGVQDKTVASMYAHYLKARGRGGCDAVIREACGQVVNSCTAAATKHLQDENFGMVWQLLSFAQECSAGFQHLWSSVYNCKACLCQQQGKHLRALRYLRKAVELNATWQVGADQRANTHLNMCAVLSRLQRHRKSLDSARKALHWAKVAHAEAKKLSLSAGESPGMNSRLIDAGTLVALSLHNAAVQHEHLREWSDARAAYHSAAHSASQCLGEHAITKTILANLQRFEAAFASAGHASGRTSHRKRVSLGDSASVPLISRAGSRTSLPRVHY